MPRGSLNSPKSRHLPPVPTSWFMILDAALIGLASALASLAATLFEGNLPRVADVVPEQSYGFWVAWTLAHAALVPLALLVLGQYRLINDLRARWSYMRVLVTLLGSFLALIFYMSLLGQPITEIARVALHFLLSLLLLVAWRSIVQRRLEAEVRSGRRVRNVLLIGEDPAMESLARELVDDPLHGRRLVGMVRGTVSIQPPNSNSGLWAPPLPTPVESAVVENSLRSPRHLWASYPLKAVDDRSRAIDGLGVEEIFLSNRLDDDVIIDWIRLANERAIDVHFVPLYHEALGIQAQPWKLGSHVVLDIHPRPINTLGWAAKRALDVTAGVVGLLLAAPAILVCAIAIKLENPRSPVFYGGKRVGLKGRHFQQWKLATMRPDADRFRAELLSKNAREGPWFQLDEVNDPRISKVGRLLRKYSLNDLPQFFNVLVGDMSMVGPRPLAADEASRFVQYDFRYYQCFDVKPGITGLWQVSDRMDPSFDRRFQLDLAYIRDWSFLLDLKIMLMTPVAMIRGGR